MKDLKLHIISRAVALKLKINRYFTGKACPKGHISQRDTLSKNCVICRRDRLRAAYHNKKDIILPKQKLYRENNLKKIAESRARWYKINRDVIALYRARYYQENKEDSSVASRNRRCRIRNSEGSHTKMDIENLVALQKSKCANCNTDISKSKHVDHIVPIISGGSNDKSNLQILCPTCNLKKNAKDPIVWAQENGRLL